MNPKKQRDSVATISSKKVIKAAMLARLGVVLVGPPGVGKTATIKEIARELGYRLITVLGSTMLPEDITGLPRAVPMAKNERGEDIYGTVYALPWWQIAAITEKKVIIFMDELSNTQDATRASLLTFFQERQLSDGTKLPSEVIIIAAMNPPEDAADGYELDNATSNRLLFLEWDPSVEEWCLGMETNWGQKASEEELEWKKTIARFIRNNHRWLHKQPVPGATSTITSDIMTSSKNSNSARAVARYAWPSRRSWDNVSKTLAKDDSKDPAVQGMIVASLVGAEASTEFIRFLAQMETQIDVKSVIADPSIVNWANISINDANMILKELPDHVSDETVDGIIKIFIALINNKRQSLGVAHIESVLLKIGPKTVSPEKLKSIQGHILKLAKFYKQIQKASE